MIINIPNITYIFQLTLAWIKEVSNAINGLSGSNGVTVSEANGTHIISLGDKQYNFRTLDCARPVYTAGKLTSIQFYTVSGFCGGEGAVSSTVDVEECECGTP